MRRRSFLGLMAVTALGLTACGKNNGGAAVSGPSRTIQDVWGKDIAVPENPQRIISLSEPTIDSLAALGVSPVGAVAGRGQSDLAPYIKSYFPNVPLMGVVSQPNFEAIGAARPDLILVDGTSVNNNQPVLDALAKIAPTVYTGNAGGDWKQNFRIVANAVNKAADGEKVIADYDARCVELKAALAPDYGDSTFSIVRWQGTSAALILKELPAGRALNDVGLKRPPSQDREGMGHSDPVSNENLKDIDADYIFFGTLGGSSVSNPNAGGTVDEAAAQQALSVAEGVPGFTDLEAYKNGKILPVDGSVWTSTGGPKLMDRILSDIQSLLL
ncbi:MAG: iron-siderophore ABC transporter substrate-binding protein [Corynebacterium sp.]|nr:iron-siderophore ABC transporter substrate-binding protein [Corynebacterium sp.]